MPTFPWNGGPSSVECGYQAQVAAVRWDRLQLSPHQIAILAFADKRKVDWHYIAPGKPTQNAFIESFNGRLRPSRRCTHRLPGNGRISERNPVPVAGSCPRHAGQMAR